MLHRVFNNINIKTMNIKKRSSAPITRCSTHDQSTKSCNLRPHQRSSKGLHSLYGFGEWPSQGLKREARMGWEAGKLHVQIPLSISAPAAAGAAGTRCTARASCLPKWTTRLKPVVGCRPPAAGCQPANPPSAKPASAPGLDIGGFWPAEGRLHEGCSVVRDVRWVRGARLGTSPA